MFKPRDYQQDCLDGCRDAFQRGIRDVMCVGSTGCGKGNIIAHIMANHLKKGGTPILAIHRDELLHDIKDRLWEQEGFVSQVIPSKQKNSYPAKICGIQSLYNMVVAGNAPPCTMLVIDEGHRGRANTYEKVVQYYKEKTNAFIIYFTATPIRGDKKGFGDQVGALVHFAKTSRLIALKYLVPPLYPRPKTSADVGQLRIPKRGEIKDEEQMKIFDLDRIYKGVVKEYQRWLKGEPAIVFCVNRKHAEYQAAAFVASGISACSIDSHTPMTDRRKMMDDFKSGKIDVVCNVGLFTEGTDVPRCSGVIIVRKIMSKGLYIQMIGRGGRPVWNHDRSDWKRGADGEYAKKNFIVLDFGGNVEEHGYWEDFGEFGFELNGDERNADAPERKLYPCAACGELNRGTATSCKSCGKEIVRPKKSLDEVVSDSTLFSDEVEFVLDMQNRTQIEKVTEMVRRLNLKQMKKLPLAYLRVAALLSGYKPGWVWHTAAERSLTTGTIDDTVSWKKLQDDCAAAEKHAGVHDLYIYLKNQQRLAPHNQQVHVPIPSDIPTVNRWR